MKRSKLVLLPTACPPMRVARKSPCPFCASPSKRAFSGWSRNRLILHPASTGILGIPERSLARLSGGHSPSYHSYIRSFSGSLTTLWSPCPHSVSPPTSSQLTSSADNGFASPSASRTDHFSDRSLSNALRAAMRAFPSPLTVVSAHPRNSVAHGMLVSSFATVTLEPTPYVSFNVRLPSRTYDAIRAAQGAFVVSALVDIETACWWARSAPQLMQGAGAGKAAHERNAKVVVGEEESFAQGSRHQDAQAEFAEPEKVVAQMLGTPLEENRRWAFYCRVKDDLCVMVGDHIIIVGEVEDVLFGNGLRANPDERLVLVWRDGDVRTVNGKTAQGEGTGIKLRYSEDERGQEDHQAGREREDARGGRSDLKIVI